MAKKKEPVVTKWQLNARIGGSLAGMSERIGMAQGTLQDIAGRCAYVCEQNALAGFLTPAEAQSLKDVAAVCDARFDLLQTQREIVDKIRSRSKEWAK